MAGNALGNYWNTRLH